MHANAVPNRTKEREREKTKKKHSSGQDTRAQRRSSGLQYLVQYMFACAILKPKTDLHESPKREAIGQTKQERAGGARQTTVREAGGRRVDGRSNSGTTSPNVAAAAAEPATGVGIGCTPFVQVGLWF